MKKLEELGISPAPWKVGDAIPYCEEHVVYTENHRHDDGSRHNKVIATCNQYFEERVADARLIAAAPDMYEALRKCVDEMWCGCDCSKCSNRGCIVLECKAALAKAAGEDGCHA